MTESNRVLIAHLLRRAGFGTSFDDLQKYTSMGYEEVVEDLLDPEHFTPDIFRGQYAFKDVNSDLLDRYYEGEGLTTCVAAKWIYNMVNTETPLKEKMALLWHHIFATGWTKSEHGPTSVAQIETFRQVGMTDIRTILITLSRDPAMIFWLDNNENHGDEINENYGRELLELFSMGVGKDEEFNYSEDDVKACARAFTGWNIAPSYPPFPYGRSAWEFRYDPADHDENDKTFLGETGNWNGQDILDMVCQQPATARFIARHLYNYFVADEVAVPSWRQTPPKDPELIKALEDAYFGSDYDITSMLRVLFNSESFKNSRYAKVKNPAEMVVSTIRFVGDHQEIKPGLFEISQEPKYMGMDLMNPPTVEGWHTGHEWIDSGTLVERINFASDYLGQTDLPGVKSLVDRLMSVSDSLSPKDLVDRCLDLVGQLQVTDATYNELVSHAQREGDLKHQSDSEKEVFIRRSGEMLQMIAATSEYQFG